MLPVQNYNCLLLPANPLYHYCYDQPLAAGIAASPFSCSGCIHLLSTEAQDMRDS